MANFTENSRTQQITEAVNVTYTLSDGSTQTVDVSIFMPKSEDDIQQGIINRGITLEQQLQDNLMNNNNGA